MKKIILITLLFAGAICAKAQQMTVDNTANSFSATLAAPIALIGACASPTYLGNGNNQPVPPSGTFGPVALNDISWGWKPAGYTWDMFQVVTIGVTGCGVPSQVVLGASCTIYPQSGTVTYCGTSHNVTWVEDHLNPLNITITIY
ncbi:MAG: hypothetical protein P4L41_02275 [Flavipsychrobacter sp.]|nr:hypothetical protein [Flavipsychrobacter sp.]